MSDVLVLEAGAGKTTAILDSIEQEKPQYGVVICGYGPESIYNRAVDRWHELLLPLPRRGETTIMFDDGSKVFFCAPSRPLSHGHNGMKFWIDDADAIDDGSWIAAAAAVNLVLVTSRPCEPWLKVEARLDAAAARAEEAALRQAEEDRLYGEEQLMMAKIAGDPADMTAINPEEFGRALRLSGHPQRRGL